ncbi:hypothetical protein K0M31_010425 [Melipona bicolor]|uniref:Uncharacterized protein n=1 Tax=Melipona bicolor TaxID=60889 RepID=A0AA40FM74_9HYME|nr:hypothetical protein K0M31_010425 [Melipona bicolor]
MLLRPAGSMETRRTAVRFASKREIESPNQVKSGVKAGSSGLGPTARASNVRDTFLGSIK